MLGSSLRRWFVLFLCLGGCAGNDPAASEPPSGFLAELEGELPVTMSALGLYPKLPERSTAHVLAVPFRPGHELWSNGTEKQRFIVLPQGSSVDSSGADWEFPEGTLLFKTFAAPRPGSPEERPIETRVLRREQDAWSYAVYSWNEDGTDAELADLSSTSRVMVEIDSEAFEHVVPSKLDCRKCHESQTSTVIGFDELRLNAPLEPGGDDSQLEALHARGVLSHVPDSPEAITQEDATTREVLGYLQGNCVHCHNGGDGPSSAFDMHHGVALENLIGRDTEGEAAAGVRVVPGAPEDSVLFLALSREASALDIQPMPPVGVQRVDAAAVELVRQWILELTPDDDF